MDVVIAKPQAGLGYIYYTMPQGNSFIHFPLVTSLLVTWFQLNHTTWLVPLEARGKTKQKINSRDANAHTLLVRTMLVWEKFWEMWERKDKENTGVQ